MGMFRSLVQGLTLSIVCILIMPKFLTLFTDDATVIDYAIRYSRIAFLFGMIISSGLSFEKTFQAVGRMKVSMLSMMAGCISNIVLDPILIFGLGPFPAMGIEGAALATGAGQVITLVIYIIIYMVKPIPVKICISGVSFKGGISRRLYSIGVPAILNMALPSLLISALNAILAEFGEVYILTLGIYYKLQTFLYLTANGMIQGMRPLVGYNYGAGEYRRVDQLYRLKKKYGATAEDMLAYLDRCRRELDTIETSEEELARLERKLDTAEGKVRAAGEALTAARKAAAGELEQRIQTELRELDMKKVRFAICFEPKEPAQDGCDAIRFLMSANAGEDLKPIAKIASGGELARIMLALKNVLSEQEDIGTLVFDEVDTGVSGRAAQKVAEKLAQVSRRKQVLCVTHLPQLAAMADVHFCVEKGEVKGRTFTQVRRLDRAQRQAELARISGGAAVTEALLQSAGELLDAAAAYREGLA